MKICFLADDPSQIGGGPEHIRKASEILRQKYGHTVDVITPLSVFPWFDVNNFLHRVLFALYTLYFILNTNYDLYHSHTFSTSIFLPLTKLRGKKTGITVHGTGKDLFGGGIVNKTFIPKFLRWLVLDVWPFDFRFSTGSLPGFTPVGNGVDDKLFSVRRRKHPGFTIFCIARPDPVKGVAILEKATAKLPGVKLRLVSGRPWTLADFANADLYVLPSLSEGLPIALLEAMAAGLPVVATDVGDCRQIVETVDCGTIVPPGDASILRQAILQMKANKNRATMGAKGRRYVQKHFLWEKVAAVYHSSYTSQWFPLSLSRSRSLL